MKHKHKLNVGFEIKSINDDGHFSGYGSTFNDVDFGGDAVMKGAFSKSLGKWAEKGRLPSLLWQHDQHQPIGVYKVIKEDAKGLYVEGQLALKTAKGAEAHELMKMDALGGLSIGYSINDEEWDSKSKIRKLKEVDLFEISVVTFPMNDKATITDVKQSLRTGEELDPREFEAFLRDAGMSRKQAQTLMSKGFSALNQSDSGEEADKQTEADIKALNTLLQKLQG